MGFFDSIKKAVGAVAKEVSGEGKEERKQEEEKLAGVRKQYLDILAPYFYTYDKGCVIPLEIQKKILEKHGITEIDQKALEQLGKPFCQEGKDATDYIYHKKAPETTIDPKELLDFLVPGVSQQILDNVLSYVDDACKYDDYTIKGQLLKLSQPVKDWKVSQCVTKLIDGVLVKDFERRIVESDIKFCEKAMKEYLSIFIYYYYFRKGELREYKISNPTVRFGVDFADIMGMAYRISNFYTYLCQDVKGEYTPITQERWEEIINKVYASEFDSLSPEGLVARRTQYLEAVSTARTSCCKLPVCSDLIYDGWIYISYRHYFKDETDFNDVVKAYDNIKTLLDEFKEKDND